MLPLAYFLKTLTFSTLGLCRHVWAFSSCGEQWLLFIVVCRRLLAEHRPRVHGLSCSAVCVIFPAQGSNLCPLHWQEDLNHYTTREASPLAWFPNFCLQTRLLSLGYLNISLTVSKAELLIFLSKSDLCLPHLSWWPKSLSSSLTLLFQSHPLGNPIGPTFKVGAQSKPLFPLHLDHLGPRHHHPSPKFFQ